MQSILKSVGAAAVIAGLAAGPAAAADTNRALTSGAHYDRNPVHVDAGTSDLLLFARSQAPCNRLAGCDPDNGPGAKYDLVVRDVKTGAQTTIPNPEPGSDWRGRTIAATRTDDGTVHVFWADGGFTTTLYHLERGRRQASFTAPEVVDTDVFNVEAVADGDDVLVYTEGSPYPAVEARRFSDGAFGAPTLVAANHSLPKAIVDKKGVVRIAMVFTDWSHPEVGRIDVASSANGLNFGSLSVAVPRAGDVLNWDPSLAHNDDGTFVLSYAPDQGGSPSAQRIEVSTSRTFSSWSAGFPLSAGTDGTTKWWDYWPEADLHEGRDVLYFASERPIGATPAGTGHIWSITR